MPTLRQISEALLSGRATTADPEYHPLTIRGQLEEVAPGLAFYHDFSNQAVLKTSDGLVLIDGGSYNPLLNRKGFAEIRKWSPDPVQLAIYSHGHVDHAYGLGPFLEECEKKGWAKPQIVAHENVLARQQRYLQFQGYNSIINSRQFGREVKFPDFAIRPTDTYRDRTAYWVGGQRLELVHAKGETDDHTWVWLPAQRTVYTGDLFIWATPNAGNPQKVQRFAIEWAQALRDMAQRKPLLLLPGHGVPIWGEGPVKEALEDTAALLESIHTQTVAALNQGLTVYEALERVKAPDALLRKPYLLPVYDEPDFIVRNLYRLYGGWYSGVPSELKPAPRTQQAQEIAALSGGVDRMVVRARELMDAGDLRMACHLADWAIQADPAHASAKALRQEVYQRRTTLERSTMAKGVFGAAARGR
jgi:alkyl sulfatase BDS1-like metallo-beta-lactamase superfamily hydrolase